MAETPASRSDPVQPERADAAAGLQNALDRAIAKRDACAQELFETDRFAAQLAIERQHLRDALDTAREQERDAARAELAPQLDAALRERDRARDERDTAAAEREASFAERDQARAAAHDAAAMLERVTASTAWRVTGPARRLLQALMRR